MAPRFASQVHSPDLRDHGVALADFEATLWT